MAEGTRERIVTATAELFRRSGYGGTSLKDISAAAGAPIGSLYHFFPGGKERLAVEALTTSGEAYRQLFVLIAGEADGPAGAVTDFFSGAAEALAESDYIDLCPIGAVAREVASTSPASREAADAVFASWVGTALTMFEESDISAAEALDLATTLVGGIEGGFLLSRTRRDPEPMLAIGRQMRRLVEVALADAAPRVKGA
jgi:AcrR family transcriptional regulator